MICDSEKKLNFYSNFSDTVKKKKKLIFQVNEYTYCVHVERENQTPPSAIPVEKEAKIVFYCGGALKGKQKNYCEQHT